MDCNAIDRLERMGGKRWTRGGLDRMYFRPTLLGLDVRYHDTGSVSRATLNGEQISNRQAKKIDTITCYVDLKTGRPIIIAPKGMEYAKRMLLSSMRMMIQRAVTVPNRFVGQEKKTEGRAMYTSITLYAYYGLLSYEKTTVYKSNRVSDELCEEGQYIVPTRYLGGENCLGQKLVNLPGLGTILMDDALQTSKSGLPELMWYDGKVYHHIELPKE